MRILESKEAAIIASGGTLGQAATAADALMEVL
jgi:hypothetical protein